MKVTAFNAVAHNSIVFLMDIGKQCRPRLDALQNVASDQGIYYLLSAI